MENFEFYNATKILFGQGRIEKISNDFKIAGVATLGECDSMTLDHLKEILRGAIS